MPIPSNSARVSPSASAGGDTLLYIQGVSKSFGGVKALTDVSFDVKRHSVTSLIGPNGAGKTTLFNCITGFARGDVGTVIFNGVDITSKPGHKVARLGMVRTFQNIRMLRDLTVYESLICARSNDGASAKKQHARANELIERLKLTESANRVCSTLPLLAQRTIEVARALMTSPEMILFDEPTAGATNQERQLLAGLISDLKGLGTTVMVIEHNVPFVMDVSDHIVVLDFGKKVADGTPTEIAQNPTVQEIYLGV